MIRVRESGGISGIGAIKMRDADNALVSIKQLYVRSAEGLGAFFASLAASASPPYANGFGYSPSPVVISTNSVTCTPVGGTAPFTFQWSTDDVGWGAISPTGATSAFRSPALASGEFQSAAFVCTVTDANGSEAVSPIIIASATNNYGPLI